MFSNHSSTGWHFTCWMALPIYPVKNCAETNNTELEYKNHMFAACSNHYSVDKWKKTQQLSYPVYITFSFHLEKHSSRKVLNANKIITEAIRTLIASPVELYHVMNNNWQNWVEGDRAKWLYCTIFRSVMYYPYYPKNQSTNRTVFVYVV